ncbi:uncharacterized protein [Amphiura filiformis]|uniref:uncharacterized protein n=1 Tax=Amphiura filiformis TaxID=82378 RepID=UPI003B213623
MEKNIYIKVVACATFLLNLTCLHCQESWSSLPSIDFDAYNYEGYGFGDLSCSSCICIPSIDMREMDIFCFVIDIPHWFTDDTTVFHLPGQFKYLSLFETRTNVAVDLPPYAFRRFKNDSLDKVHFHGVSFGITDERAFREFPLKYLLIDSITMMQGGNSFTSLFTAINALKRTLMELHIVDIHTLNELTQTVDLPPIEDFTALTTLVLDRVPLKTIKENTFNNLPSLKHLSLTGCPLVSVSSDAFVNVPELTVLQIASSQLTQLPSFLYKKHLANLEVLSLKDSFIGDVENFEFLETFSTSGIRFLDLRKNGIKEISPYAVANLNSSLTRNLEALYLWDNEFHCDCDLLPFVQWLQSVNVRIDVKFESSLTKIEEIFARDPHCIPGKLCTDIHKESRLQNSIPHCASPQDQDGVSLLSMKQMSCKQNKPRFSQLSHMQNNGFNSFQFRAVVILSLAAFLVFSILLAIMVKPVKSWKRFVTIFRGNSFQLDAYVFHHNVKFVTEKLIPRLEEQPKNLKFTVKICDLQIGTDLAKSDMFRTSRVALFLIDSEFVNSDRCMLQLNVACSHLLDANRQENQKQNGIILLFLDSTSLAVKPETLTCLGSKLECLSWNEDIDDDSVEEERKCRQFEALLHKMTGSYQKTKEIHHVQV